MEEKLIARNEPCPCRSGKKYKRCCGAEAAPVLGAPRYQPFKPGPSPGSTTAKDATGSDVAASGMIPGFDPSQVDPQMLMQVSQALQRLPHHQMQKLQSIMQKAMAGKDVTREAADFEKSLPPDVRQTLQVFSQNLPAGIAGGAGATAGLPMDMGDQPPAFQGAGGGVEGAEGTRASSSQNMTVDQARAIVEQAVSEGRLSREEADKLLGGQVAGK